MPWTTLQYSRGKIDKLGARLIAPDLSGDEQNEALAAMGNWRAAHSYPLEVALIALRRKARTIDPKAIIASRLKRFPAIALKLRREPMRLTQMQDIGGCRAVLRNMDDVRALLGTYKLWSETGDLKETNYISAPKETGYRSVHFIWKYQPKRGWKQNYAGMRVEIQIRTALQHAWATAVEMASTYKNEDLKFGEGDPKWRRFFALMGSAIAKAEDAPLVPGTPDRYDALRRELRKLSDELGVEALMQHWTELTAIRDSSVSAARKDLAPGANAKVFLIRLYSGTYRWQVIVRAYRDSESSIAAEEYLQAEKDAAQKHNVQVALVSVESIDQLSEAYPNYYQDTSQFLKAVQTVLYGTRGEAISIGR